MIFLSTTRGFYRKYWGYFCTCCSNSFRDFVLDKILLSVSTRNTEATFASIWIFFLDKKLLAVFSFIKIYSRFLQEILRFWFLGRKAPAFLRRCLENHEVLLQVFVQLQDCCDVAASIGANHKKLNNSFSQTIYKCNWNFFYSNVHYYTQFEK